MVWAWFHNNTIEEDAQCVEVHLNLFNAEVLNKSCFSLLGIFRLEQCKQIYIMTFNGTLILHVQDVAQYNSESVYQFKDVSLYLLEGQICCLCYK